MAALATAVFRLPAVITDATVGKSGLLTHSGVGLHAEDYLAVVDGRTPLVDYIGEYANLLPFAFAPLVGRPRILRSRRSRCTLSAVPLLAIFGVFSEVTRRPWAAPPGTSMCGPGVRRQLLRHSPGSSLRPVPARVALRAFDPRPQDPRPDPVPGRRTVRDQQLGFGVGALIASAIALILGSERSTPLSRRLRELGRGATIGLAPTVAIVCAITLVRAGSLPNPALLNYFSRLVLRQSFGLLPMPSLGLHWALNATYVAALLVTTVDMSAAMPTAS